MSLLMDALRKAEADKKQASAATVGAEPAAQDLPQDDDIDLAETIASPVKSAAAAASVQSVIDPEIQPPRKDPLALEPLEAEPDFPADDTSPSEHQVDAPSNADPSLTMPTPRGVEAQRDNYFEESQSTTGPQPDPLAELAVAPAVSSGITETVASAHTVFEAGTQGPSKRVIVWGSVIAVVIGCVFVGAGIYYFQQAPAPHQIPSPSVAAKVESMSSKPLPIVVLDPEPESPAPSVTETQGQVDVARPPIGATATVEAQADATATPSVPDDFAKYALPELDVDGNDATAKDGATASFQVSESSENGERLTAQAVTIGVRPGEVRIARSTKSFDTDDIMRRAYAAYVGGDYATSEELYQEVLRHKPQQRDALLGVAALKLRAGKVADAHRLYRDVLKRDPKNPTANAAMFSLESGEGDNVTESRLKLLLDEGVDVGYIYFSLGNLYARNRRWSDAQQAYFEALRNSPTNPDYNYNLAVSLDRIGQRASAVKYYEAAVGYTDSRQARFDPALALARIQSIGRESTP